MYYSVLLFHSWWRWAVTLFLLLAFFRSTSAWIFNFRYKREDKILGRLLVGSTHLQILVGLVLYFGLSPIIHMAMNHTDYAMKVPSLRFWFVEHVVTMLVFLVLVQVGQILSKRTIYDRQKHKRMAIFTGLAILVLCVGMPWPGSKNARPLFREAVKQENLR
jgi:hypothetical protein